jgi:hypothetical protein
MILRGFQSLGMSLVLLLTLSGGHARAQAPDGQLTWASYHITIAPSWFDPADTPAIITPFTYYYAIHDYAIHDALVKPMPGQPWRRASPSPGPPAPTGWPMSSCCARASGSTTVIR